MKDNIEDEFKKVIDHKRVWSDDKLQKEFGLPSLDEYKGFTLQDSTTVTIDIDSLFDPKIKKKILELYKKDQLKRNKHKEKEWRKNEKLRIKSIKELRKYETQTFTWEDLPKVEDMEVSEEYRKNPKQFRDK